MFKDYIESTVRESNFLRSQGADIILLLSHVGLQCNKGDINELRNLELHFPSSSEQTNCSSDGELMVFLHSLPNGIVDAVIGGHTHEIVHHFINGTPVVIGESQARYFNVIYLPWDKKNKQLMRDKVIIEGPVPVCERIPENERTCFTKFMKNNMTDDIKLEKFKFHGKFIEEDQKLVKDLDEYIQKGLEYKKSTLARIENPMFNSRDEESPLGDYVCDVLINYTKSEICIFNKGGIRINWEKGPLTYYTLFQTFPFNNFVTTFELNGEELIKVMRILQRGKKGFYHTSGLRQEVCLNPHSLNDVKLINGKEIDLQRNYKIVSNDFLVEGGDDFRDIKGDFQLKCVVKLGNLRDVIGDDLIMKKSINSNDKPCLDNKFPRLIIIKNC